jgi:hypothetical protein
MAVISHLRSGVVRDSFVALFYYFRLEGQVLETHLLRLIDKYVDSGFDDQTESVKASCTVSFPFEMQHEQIKCYATTTDIHDLK